MRRLATCGAPKPGAQAVLRLAGATMSRRSFPMARAPPLVRFFSRPAALPAAAKMDRLHVVLDQSGSMRSMNETVYEGARELLDGVAEDGTVCVTRFADEVALGTDMTPRAAQATWAPSECSGLTALHDAITAAIEHDLQRHAELDTVTIAIVTDGAENASRRARLSNVKKLIKQTDEKGWRVVFLGSNQDAVLTAETMGIRSGHSMTFGHTRHEARGAFQSLRAANSRWARGGDEAFTHTERLQGHYAHISTPSNQPETAVDLGFDSPGQTKWVSVDPRSGDLVEFDAATSADIEYAWTTQQSTVQLQSTTLGKLGAVVFFDSGGNHVQKTRHGERCLRYVSQGDTVFTRACGANGYRVVGMVESGEPWGRWDPGTRPIALV